MHHVHRRATAAVALALALLGGASLRPATAQAKSLYERLGRYDGIATVVDDFLARALADPRIARFFAGHSTDSRHRFRQQVVEQICMLAGGPCVYTGRPMKAAHAGLGITEDDWQLTVKYLVASLDKFNVPAKEKEEVLAALSKFKADIVEK